MPAFTLRLRAENAPVIAVCEAGRQMSEGSRLIGCAMVAALALAAALAAPPPGGAAGVAGAARPGAATPGKPAKGELPSTKRPGPTHGEQTTQGVVQAVSASAVVLKQLDGSTVRVPVSAKTRVLVDGKTALLGHVKPGFVAIARWKDDKPTHELQALSPQAAASVAVVQSVLADAVVVTAAGGATVTIRANAKTRVFLGGQPAKLRDLEPGFTLVSPVNYANGGKPVRELRFLRPS